MTFSKANSVQTPDAVVLTPLSEAQLRSIAHGDSVSIPGFVIADCALPPPHVALRSLHHLEGGCPPEWALPLHIVDARRQTIVGGCTFKGLPIFGSVEIGYGIAPSCQRRGFASAAIRQLLVFAARSGMVSEVFALISNDNVASAAVVARTGFSRGPTVLDTDGESVVRWHWQCVA